MGNFQYYNYELLRTIQNSKKPQNTHLIFETTYGIYFVDSSDNTILLKTDDEGLTVSTVVDRDRDIVYGWYDRDNEYIWLVDDNGPTRVSTFYLRLSDDTIPSFWDYTLYYIPVDVIIPGYLNRIYYILKYYFVGNLYIAFDYWRALGDWTTNMGSVLGGARTAEIGYFTSDGAGISWCLFKWSNENVELWKVDYNGNSFTQLKDCGANTELPSKNQRAIAYDGNDILYFVLQDTSNSKYYLYSYVISTDTLTKGGVYNIALMLERNNAGVFPSKTEKAFHITTQEIFKVKLPINNRVPQGLTKFSTINSSNTMVAITDSYLIDSEAQLYKYVDVSSNLHELEIRHDTRSYPKMVSI